MKKRRSIIGCLMRMKVLAVVVITTKIDIKMITIMGKKELLL